MELVSSQPPDELPMAYKSAVTQGRCEQVWDDIKSERVGLGQPFLHNFGERRKRL